MKDFHRGFICRSTETGKKTQKSKQNEICKCYAPFLKLHYYDCPAARKPCPIHGKPYRHSTQNDKAEKKDNIVISLHPSSKTDRLFGPVKNLLTHCNPETKISLEYYALNNSVSKEGMKHRQVQTNPEELKKSLRSNVFVEKTKSFVTDKTNRMKRLKQCFHSPCNSIMARTRSEIAVKNKMNENFCGIAKDAAVATNISEKSSNVFFYGKSKWTSNKLDSSDWEKSSEDKVESDFITVTKQVENKLIDHKIFEINHRKEFDGVRFTKLPKQSQFVYSSFDTEKSKNANTKFSIQVEPLPNQKSLEKYSNNNEQKKKIDQEEISSSEKSQSSSSGSIYFTPAILVPPDRENDTGDESKYADDMLKERPKEVDEEVKAEDTEKGQGGKKSVQTETPVLEKNKYESSSASEDSVVTKIFEPKNEPVLEKQEKGVGSEHVWSSDNLVITPEQTPSFLSKGSWKKSSVTTDASQATNKPVNKSTQVSPAISHDLFDNRVYNKKERTQTAETLTVFEETPKRLSSKVLQVQTDAIQKKEISLLYDETKNVADKSTQTETVFTKDVQVETMVGKKDKSEMTYWTAVKSIQTSFTLSDSQSQSQEGDFTDGEPHVKYVMTSYTRPDSKRADDKAPWKKSHSVGNFYNEQRSNPESENLISVHHVCLCENSETSISDSDYNSYVKISKQEESDTNSMVQNENEGKPTAVKKDTKSKGEQTSLSDLSELARMVDQFFDKMSREAFKSCECEKIKRDSKINQGIQADPSKSAKNPMTNTLEAETQTSFKIIFDSPDEDRTKESSKKVHQSVNTQDNGENIYVCKLCRRKVDIDDASLEKAEISAKKDMFVSVGTSTEDFVGKRSVGVSVPENNPTMCFAKKRPLCMSQCVSTSEMHYTSDTKSLWTRSCLLENSNRESAKNGSANITSKERPIPSGQSTSKREPDPQQRSVEKEPATSNQTKGKKNIKKPPVSESWKYPNYYNLGETSERRSVCKSSDVTETKLEAGKCRSGIPTAASTNRRHTNFKDKEPDECNLNARVIFMQYTNRPSFNTQGASKVSRTSDQKPPLPKKSQPGGSSPRRNSNGSTSPCPRKPSNDKKFIFPAIIRPIWYKDLRKTLQIMKNCQSFHESKSTLKQKRLWEEDDLPGGKKIKNKENGSGESCVFEQGVHASSEGQIIDMRKSIDFVWVPSSAQQLPKAEARSKSLLKGTQAESKATRTCLQNSTSIKGFNKRNANVLSVKSCRLKPVQVNEKHPFRKLFECRLCKSLNFLKTDQKDSLKNDHPSEGSFGYNSPRGEEGFLVPQDEDCVPENWLFTPRADEEFVVGYSFSSGSTDSDDSAENDDFVEDECEEKNGETELSSASPSGALADEVSNLPPGSQSFDLFWFGSDIGKK